MIDASVYPATAAARDRFVLSRRPARPRHDPWRSQGVCVEEERAADGTIVRAATIFLTGRECPWRCAMCDLWRYTIAEDTPPGALVAQVHEARRRLGAALPVHVKLYNAGSFFDPHAVPDADYVPLAAALAGFRHVIVESHPSLLGARLRRWMEALAAAGAPSLEVAMGLETAHPAALEQLHKRFTLDQFARAARRVREAGAALRVFVLVGVPFVPRAAQLDWLERSAVFAFDNGASVVSLIPTRPGNGTLEALGRHGLFDPPGLADLEAAMDRVLPGARGRIFADLWDVDRLATCGRCLDARRERLRLMNLTQGVVPPVSCLRCNEAER